MSINHIRSKSINRFLIPNDFPIVKSVLNKCQNCFVQIDQSHHAPDKLDLPEYKFNCSKPWKETILDMTNHYLLRISMVTHLPSIMVTHLPCMPSRKLLQMHLKGSILRIGFPKTKPFLTRVATFKLLIMILKYSDNDNSGEICVGSIIKIGKSDNGGNRKAILN